MACIIKLHFAKTVAILLLSSSLGAFKHFSWFLSLLCTTTRWLMAMLMLRTTKCLSALGVSLLQWRFHNVRIFNYAIKGVPHSPLRYKEWRLAVAVRMHSSVGTIETLSAISNVCIVASFANAKAERKV